MLSGDFYYGPIQLRFLGFSLHIPGFLLWPAPAIAIAILAIPVHCHFVRAIKSPNRPSGLSAPKCGLPLFANIATCIIMKGHIRLWLNG